MKRALAEFHVAQTPALLADRLHLLQTLHNECQRLSNDRFLLRGARGFQLVTHRDNRLFELSSLILTRQVSSHRAYFTFNLTRGDSRVSQCGYLPPVTLAPR